MSGASGNSGEGQINQYRVMRLSMWALGFVGAVLFTAGVFIDPKLETAPIIAATPAEELGQILQRLRITQDERARGRVVAQARTNRAALVEPLLTILRQPDHPLLVPAVQCAAVLRSPELRSVLDGLAKAGREPVRVAAIAAAEQIEPWSSEQLARFLDDDSTAVRIAALELMPGREDVPWEETLALLSSEDARVRLAVVEAVPEDPPANAVRVLVASIRNGGTDEAVAGLRALRRTGLAGEFETAATDLLALSEPEVQHAALELLTAKGSALLEPEVVWGLVRDEDLDLPLRAKAFQCLELTRSYDVEELRDYGFEMEPVLGYHAARCLIDAKEPVGIDLLLELLDSGEVRVVAASRRLLAEMTGLPDDAEREEFTAAVVPERALAVALPPPGRDL